MLNIYNTASCEHFEQKFLVVQSFLIYRCLLISHLASRGGQKGGIFKREFNIETLNLNMWHNLLYEPEKVLFLWYFSAVFSGLGSRNTNSRSPGMTRNFFSRVCLPSQKMSQVLYACFHSIHTHHLSWSTECRKTWPRYCTQWW